MPVQVSYPGVYIQEIPSGSHAIAGVSTSLTAFVGRTDRGPVNTPVRINSFGDFQRYFGGLAEDSPLSYAVQDFFQNGGVMGEVVRLFHGYYDDTDPSNVQGLQDAAQAAAKAVNVKIQGVVTTGNGNLADYNALVAAANGAAAQYISFPQHDAAQAVIAALGAGPQDLATLQKIAAGVVNDVQTAAATVSAAVAALNLPATATGPSPAALAAAQRAAATIPGDADSPAAAAAQAMVTAVAGTAAADTPAAAAKTALNDLTIGGAGAVQSAINVSTVTTAAEAVAAAADAIPAATNVNAHLGGTLVSQAVAAAYPDLTAMQALAAAAATVPSDGTVSPAVAAVLGQLTATLTVQGNQVLAAALAAANAVANGAWLKAATSVTTTGAGAPTAATTASAAAAAAIPYRSAVEKQAAQAVVRTAQGAVAGAQPTDVATAAANAVALAALTAAGVLASDPLTLAADAAQAVVTKGWTAAVAANATTADVTSALTPGGDPATGAVSAAAAAALAASINLTPAGLAQAAADAVPDALGAATTPLPLVVANPGSWANDLLTAQVDTKGITQATVASLVQQNALSPASGAPPFAQGDFFNLSVVYASPDASLPAERYVSVSLRGDAGPQRLDRVLANRSNLVRYTGPLDQPAPSNGAWGEATGGTDSGFLQMTDYEGDEATKTGLYALEKVRIFNLLVMPPDNPGLDQDALNGLWSMAAEYCEKRLAFLIVDPPLAWENLWGAGQVQQIANTDLGTFGPEGENAAVFFPRIVEADPLMNGQRITVWPSGAMAGIFARTDVNRGVWKAPAGINDGAISGSLALSVQLSDTDSGLLNPLGINCLRTFPVFGNVVWGSRTLKGADQYSDDYKYIPVRRLALYIEQSLLQGTQWAVFEPNAEPLWANLRLAVGGFMNGLYAQGAFAGASAATAFYVRCDATTTSATDIELGRVNVQVGYAPLDPAEFVVITIQQIAGQTQG